MKIRTIIRNNWFLSIMMLIGFIFASFSVSAQVTNDLQKDIPSETIPLWTGQSPVGDGTFSDQSPAITVFRPIKGNGTMIVICPGGGYGIVGVNGAEGNLRAKWLNKFGIVGVVLNYRLPQGRCFVPLLDAQRAIRLVRSKAHEWECDPKRIGIMGFSAGGHLASTAATHFDRGSSKASDPIDRMGCRPDFAILIYPVITMGSKTHNGSKNNLLGSNPEEKTITWFSSEKQVTKHTPPTFLAHAQDDTTVSPDNSQMFYDALLSHHVPATYLKLPTGGHGLNGYSGPMWDAWLTQSLQWLVAQKIIPSQTVR